VTEAHARPTPWRRAAEKIDARTLESFYTELCHYDGYTFS